MLQKQKSRRCLPRWGRSRTDLSGKHKQNNTTHYTRPRARVIQHKTQGKQKNTKQPAARFQSSVTLSSKSTSKPTHDERERERTHHHTPGSHAPALYVSRERNPNNISPSTIAVVPNNTRHHAIPRRKHPRRPNHRLLSYTRVIYRLRFSHLCASFRRPTQT